MRDCKRDVYKVSKAVEEWTEQLTECYMMPENGFSADILNAAIREVNFYEIIEEIEPEESDDEPEGDE